MILIFIKLTQVLVPIQGRGHGKKQLHRQLLHHQVQLIHQIQ